MQATRFSFWAARSQLARSLHHARNGVTRVVGVDARRLHQNVGVEPSFREQIGGGSGQRRDRREQMPSGRAFFFLFGELIGQPAQRHELGFVQPSDLVN